MQILYLIFIVWFVCNINCSFAGNTQLVEKFDGPQCIADFCFNVKTINQLTTEQKLINRYGKGYSEDGKFAFYCYEVPEQKAFVRFRPYHGEQRAILDVFLSDASSCPETRKSNVPFKSLTTREGLKLGDAIEKVISLYGKPDLITKGTAIEKIGDTTNPSPFGDTVFTYRSRDNSLLQAQLYLRRDKVSAILISVSP